MTSDVLPPILVSNLLPPVLVAEPLPPIFVSATTSSHSRLATAPTESHTQQLSPAHAHNNYHLLLDLPGYWSDYDFKVGYMNIPEKDGFTMLGKDSIYPADFWPTLTNNFDCEKLIRLQRKAEPAGSVQSKSKPVALIPEPLKGPRILSELMLSQLECSEHKPTQDTISDKRFYMQQRFATLLAACMTFNTISLPSRFPKQLFRRDPFTVTAHWKSAFYEQANLVYWHNLFLVYKMLHLTVPPEELCRSLFTTMNATNDILSYMSSGVFAEWNEMVQSNKNTKGKSTSTNTGMHVIEFFFLFPLVAGSFAERKSIIPLFTMLKTKSASALRQLRDEFNIPTPCHINDNGGIVLPVSSITGTNHYNQITAQVAQGARQEKKRRIVKEE